MECRLDSVSSARFRTCVLTEEIRRFVLVLFYNDKEEIVLMNEEEMIAAMLDIGSETDFSNVKYVEIKHSTIYGCHTT